MIGSYDMNKAKLIWRARISAARTAEFEKNDLRIRDAQISGDSAALSAAIARRDELRAMGDRINAATSIANLKSITP